MASISKIYCVSRLLRSSPSCSIMSGSIYSTSPISASSKKLFLPWLFIKYLRTTWAFLLSHLRLKAESLIPSLPIPLSHYWTLIARSISAGVNSLSFRTYLLILLDSRVDSRYFSNSSCISLASASMGFSSSLFCWFY